MNERQTVPSKPEFSPGLATLFSLPLFLLISGYFGPRLWQQIADSVGWIGTNFPYLLRRWVLGRDLTGWFVAVACSSPAVAIFCFKTRGHNVLRCLFLTIHAAGWVVLIGDLWRRR